MSVRFHIHPLWVVRVMQMLRHGEERQAARWVAAELWAAMHKRRERGRGDDGAGDEGPIYLPTPQRRAELGYPDITLYPTKPPEPEPDDERLAPH